MQGEDGSTFPSPETVKRLVRKGLWDRLGRQMNIASTKKRISAHFLREA